MRRPPQTLQLIVSAFLMQGWGQVANLVVLLLGLLIYNGGNPMGPYSTSAAQATFRGSFGPSYISEKTADVLQVSSVRCGSPSSRR